MLRILLTLVAGLVFLLSGAAHADIKISGDWHYYDPEDKSHPNSNKESENFRSAAHAASYSRDAMGSYNGPRDSSRLINGYKFYVDKKKYYFQPARFMSKSRPNEVCTPAPGPALAYKCSEGQRLTSDCHLMFFDINFREAGVNTVKVNEPYQFFCNMVVAVGVGAKGSDDLLVTIQYFPIDGKPASKVGEIGSGWNRMTALFHIKAVDGKIVAEQDDSCLGNPNRVDNIPEARRRLEKCSMASVPKP